MDGVDGFYWIPYKTTACIPTHPLEDIAGDAQRLAHGCGGQPTCTDGGGGLADDD